MSYTKQAEKWLPVVGYEDLYEVSDLGNVRRTRKYRNSKDAPLKTVLVAGYPRVTLSKDNIPKAALVHRLVADAFIGIKDGLVVNHLDGDKTNNRLANLEVVTRKENERHKWDVLGRGARSKAKLTQTKADAIRILRRRGWTLKRIAENYGISIGNVHFIVTDRTWIRLKPPSGGSG